MCYDYYVGYVCGHSWPPVFHACPLTQQVNSPFTRCAIPARHFKQENNYCPACFRVVWSKNILENEDRIHREWHTTRGQCWIPGCNDPFRFQPGGADPSGMDTPTDTPMERTGSQVRESHMAGPRIQRSHMSEAQDKDIEKGGVSDSQINEDSGSNVEGSQNGKAGPPRHIDFLSSEAKYHLQQTIPQHLVPERPRPDPPVNLESISPQGFPPGGYTFGYPYNHGAWEAPTSPTNYGLPNPNYVAVTQQPHQSSAVSQSSSHPPTPQRRPGHASNQASAVPSQRSSRASDQVPRPEQHNQPNVPSTQVVTPSRTSRYPVQPHTHQDSQQRPPRETHLNYNSGQVHHVFPPTHANMYHKNRNVSESHGYPSGVGSASGSGHATQTDDQLPEPGVVHIDHRYGIGDSNMPGPLTGLPFPQELRELKARDQHMAGVYPHPYGVQGAGMPKHRRPRSSAKSKAKATETEAIQLTKETTETDNDPEDPEEERQLPAEEPREYVGYQIGLGDIVYTGDHGERHEQKEGSLDSHTADIPDRQETLTPDPERHVWDKVDVPRRTQSLH